MIPPKRLTRGRTRMERATGTPETECPAGVTHKQRIETTRGGKKRRQAPPAAQTNKKQRKDADRSYPFHSSLGESSGLVRENILRYIPNREDKALFIWSLLMLGTIDRKTAKAEFLRHLRLTDDGIDYGEKPVERRTIPELKRMAGGLGREKLSALKKDDLLQIVRPFYASSAYIPLQALTLIKHWTDIQRRKKGLIAVVGEEALAGISRHITTYKYVDTSNVLEALLSDPNRRCTKGTLMKVLGFTDAEVEAMPCDYVQNPYYRSAAPMRLYSLLGAIKAAVRKFGSWNALVASREQKKEKKEAAARKRRENAASRRDQRRNELLEAFRPRNLTIRSDSRLTNEYLARQTGSDSEAQYLARIMDEMRFYHQHTDYREFYHIQVQDELEYKGRFNRDEVSYLAQEQALEQWVRDNLDRWSTAIEHPEFPPSLRGRAEDLADNERRRRARNNWRG